MKKLFAVQTVCLKWLPFLLFASIETGCADDVEKPEPIENAVRLDFESGSGSGVYLGGGIVLTNWHIAVSSAIVDIETDWQMSDEDYLVLYNAADDGNPEVAVGPDSNASYCLDFDQNFNSLGYVVTDDPASENIDQISSNFGYHYCLPVTATSSMWCNFTEVNVPLKSRSVQVSELLYANMDLDLGIVGVDVNPTLASQLDVLELSDTAPTQGQRVRIGGYPNGVASAVYEACEVVSAEVEALADPDPIMPSKLVVPSFKINCNTARHGSSGSVVIDDKTDTVIGLIWTAEFDENDNVTVVYASAISAWKQLIVAAENPESHSQLAWLLAEFGSKI